MAVAFLRPSRKFDLYWYLFTLGSKIGDVVTKAVPFIFRQTEAEKYPLTSLVVLRSVKNKRHSKDCYMRKTCVQTTCSVSEAIKDGRSYKDKPDIQFNFCPFSH